ncbi:hypothetical protein [Caldalkalibacillus salinus]|uniref:hypothetical protein n=1 Tax=Caldalkalibacillus salinus TaxID=2803787 RepID=UPI001920EC0D|nr:hypothetical protein [Caldalkalibacillus salinus]
MESNKYIKPFMIFVSAALVVSLIVNFNLLSRVGEIENSVYSLSNNQHNMITDINGQSGQIRHVLNEFKEEQSWLGQIERNVNMDAIDQGQVALSYTWQVKELQPGSEVVFHYAYGQSDEFTSLPAEELQQGLFQVNLPLEVDMEPRWEIYQYTVNRSDQSHAVEEQEVFAKEEVIKERDETALRYFVSVTNDDMVRSGDMQKEHLDHLGTSKYGHIQTDIHLDEENFAVNLEHYTDSMQRIEEASLLMYEDNTLISEQEIERDEHRSPDEHYQFFRLEQQKRDDQARHVIKVRYSDGETFEKEI